MGASGLNVAHAPCRRYGGLAYRGGRYGGLAYRGGRYGGLAYHGERYGELPLPPRSAPSRSARALR